MRVAGFVLVGGRSSRMGRDKARLPLESHLLVEDVAAKVRNVAGNVALIGESHRYRDLQLECLDDLRPCLGPLGGIEAALASGRGEFNIIAACDTPNLEEGWLRRLLFEAKERNAHCMICQDTTGKVHPLCSVWKTSCLPAAREALDHRRLRVLDLVQKLQAGVLSIEQPMYNLNTPQDWAEWQNRRSSGAVSFN
ncbi:MAG: molybdenum cofactor guanylyltransferase [Acidobacteriota bacterium]|nr:molybdenum cofactor guanylyltransferase [Acidobacteriota bacterium]